MRETAGKFRGKGKFSGGQVSYVGSSAQVVYVYYSSFDTVYTHRIGASCCWQQCCCLRGLGRSKHARGRRRTRTTRIRSRGASGRRRRPGAGDAQLLGSTTIYGPLIAVFLKNCKRSQRSSTRTLYHYRYEYRTCRSSAAAAPSRPRPRRRRSDWGASRGEGR